VIQISYLIINRYEKLIAALILLLKNL